MEQNKKNEMVDRLCYKCQVNFCGRFDSNICNVDNKKSLCRRIVNYECIAEDYLRKDGFLDFDYTRTEFVRPSLLNSNVERLFVFRHDVVGYKYVDGELIYSEPVSIVAWL